MVESSEKKQTSNGERIPERVLLKENPNNSVEFRKLMADWLYREVVGPKFDEYSNEEGLTIPPSQLYSAGILFPRVTQNDDKSKLSEELLDIETEELEYKDEISDHKRELKHDGSDIRDDVDEDDEINRANEYMPSALGLSFVVSHEIERLNLTIYASNYIAASYNGSIKTRYVRHPLRIEKNSIDVSRVEVLTRNDPKEVIQDSDLYLYVTRRPALYGTVVTISLVNKKIAETQNNYEDMFFQVGLEVELENTNESFLPYTQILEQSSKDFEVSQLDLLYRDRKAYAVGHGTSIEWDVGAEKINKLTTSALPQIRIPPVEPTKQNFDCLSMLDLSGEGDKTKNEIIEILRELPVAYKSWIHERYEEAESLENSQTEVAEQNLKLCSEAVSRINDGIDLLVEDDLALEAFCLSNKAMLLQQVHYSRKTREIEDSWEELPSFPPKLAINQGKWRVFQLAFILMNLRGAFRGYQDPSRELVDLIWFPTGGGKTEAYLGLSAYVIFVRRLHNPDDAGCTVLMRYTLRLLTVQQFQRAASLICACENIRKSYPVNKLGNEAISIGLWVGDSLSPNKRDSAKRALKSLLESSNEGDNPFQIVKCPWCGTALNKKPIGYSKLNGTVKYICPEPRCDFSRKKKKTLPIFVIDEDIYDSPPTMIIGTVDKFAMLAWNSDAGSIFGNDDNSPPDLVIQDELHLISGPVGTMVGLYESVISDLCHDEHNRGPKIVGSTATIRRAADQCKALYDREVFQFPPQGISADDNFFAKEDKEHPGRLYIGFMPTGASSFVTGLVRAFSALLEAGHEINADDDVKDGYWTLVQYYNSLRELGRGVTFLQQDIPEWMRLRARADGRVERGIYNFVELTARQKSGQIPEILDRLSTKKTDDESKKPYDSLLATSMISVGVDVPRLGLMAIIGQPKTTSEYIQASSRVGRGNAPGLVVTCYNPSKARDRSHFETFTQYHNSIYRFVEPTSVTPFSIPAMEKALHAILIIAARHISKFPLPSEFDSNEQKLRKFCERLIDRCRRIDEFHVDELENKMEKFLGDTWDKTWYQSWGNLGKSNVEEHALMAPPDTSEAEIVCQAIPTPSSMRGVDSECMVRVLFDRTIDVD